MSHRFSIVRSVHLILVIDSGGVTDLRSHAGLTVRGGLYSGPFCHFPWFAVHSW